MTCTRPCPRVHLSVITKERKLRANLLEICVCIVHACLPVDTFLLVVGRTRTSRQGGSRSKNCTGLPGTANRDRSLRLTLRVRTAARLLATARLRIVQRAAAQVRAPARLPPLLSKRRACRRVWLRAFALHSTLLECTAHRGSDASR
jgi:hypothetical protein